MGRKLKIWRVRVPGFIPPDLGPTPPRVRPQEYRAPKIILAELILFRQGGREHAGGILGTSAVLSGFCRWRTRSGRSDPRDMRALAGTHPRRAHDPATGTNGRDNTQFDAR